MTQFYSYLWLRKNGTPYYAGKGTGNRAFVSNNHGVHRPKECSRILVFPMTSEAEAFESEIALIDLFGRKDKGTGCLRNLTAGGENPPNWKGRKRKPFTQDHRRRLSESHKGGKGFTGRHSAESIERIRKAHLGKKASQITRKKMRDAWMTKSPEYRHQRAVAAATARWGVQA